MIKFKRAIIICLAISFALASQSCFKHRRQLRVKNTFSNPLHIIVGPVDFGTVPTGKTTAYHDIPKGHSDISGDIEGSINVPSGKHIYTLWINSGGTPSLLEDNK